MFSATSSARWLQRLPKITLQNLDHCLKLRGLESKLESGCLFIIVHRDVMSSDPIIGCPAVRDREIVSNDYTIHRLATRHHRHFVSLGRIIYRPAQRSCVPKSFRAKQKSKSKQRTRNARHKARRTPPRTKLKATQSVTQTIQISATDTFD